MKSALILAILFLFLCSPVLAAKENCIPEKGTVIKQMESEQYLVAFSSLSEKIQVGQPFSVHVRVCDRAGKPVDVDFKMDAWMPHHNHGMNYRPKITPQSAGVFLVEGFVLHMPGHWQFTFTLKDQDSTVRLAYDTMLK